VNFLLDELRLDFLGELLGWELSGFVWLGLCQGAKELTDDRCHQRPLQTSVSFQTCLSQTSYIYILVYIKMCFFFLKENMRGYV